MVKRILVGVTGGAAATAKRRFAMDLAQRHKASIEILSIVDVERLAHVGPVPLGGVHDAQKVQESRIHRSHELADAAIATFEEQCRAAGIPYIVHVHEGDPFDVLTREWRYNDLAIFAVRDWFDHEVVREPEKTLVRLATADIWPIIAVSENTDTNIKKVLFAYDESKEAADALKSFARSGIFPNAHCHIVYFGSAVHDKRKQLERASGYLRDYGYQTTIETVDASVHDRLLPHADDTGADMIVMGCDTHTSYLKRVYSEVSLDVIRKSRRPVFLAH
jgi:nucleotide-binding universal stress UspA family protein